MMWLATPLIIVILAIVFSAFTIYLMMTIKKLKKSINDLSGKETANNIFYSDLQSLVQNLDAKLTQEIESNEKNISRIDIEYQQIIKQLEHRIDTIKKEHNKFNEELGLIKDQQHPKDKLYSRANKLASLGADVEEIMRECDLPRAEADLLLTVYQRSKDS